jgi:ferredoxin
MPRWQKSLHTIIPKNKYGTMGLTEKTGRCNGHIINTLNPRAKKGEIMAKTVGVDEEKCTGCGTCAAIAEDCFELNEETEKAAVISQTACSEDQIQEAIDTCPEEAISWQ